MALYTGLPLPNCIPVSISLFLLPRFLNMYSNIWNFVPHAVASTIAIVASYWDIYLNIKEKASSDLKETPFYLRLTDRVIQLCLSVVILTLSWHSHKGIVGGLCGICANSHGTFEVCILRPVWTELTYNAGYLCNSH
jgi:hypothetical protein